jgi:hypothetical protein
MQLKPDRLNGQTIYRGVERGNDGINHVNKLILFPPSMTAMPGPVLTLDELTEQALAKIVTIAHESGDPVIKAQAIAFRADLKKTLAFWLKRAALNERERCRQRLAAHGFAHAAAFLSS